MATKSVYQKINEEALKLYQLEETPLTGVFSIDGSVQEVIKVSKDLYNNLVDLIKTPTVNDLSTLKNKKVFLIPLSPVSINRVKYILSENSIKMTNDYEEADFIITHNNFNRSFYGSSDNVINSALCFYYSNHVLVSKITNENSITQPLIDYIKSSGNDLILDNKKKDTFRHIRHENDIITYNSCEYYVTGMMLNIAEKIQNSLLNVIDLSLLTTSISNKIVLTEGLKNDLIMQIQSTNKEDIDMAAMVLPTIDYGKNMHVLWEFSKIYYSLSKFNRNKDVKEWIERADIRKLYNLSPEDMIMNLKKDGNLTKTYFNYFEPLARKDIQIYNRNIYNFKVSIKPEFLEFNEEEI
jgi:molybdopterin-guanine dinucleotide biosynthesis protein